MRSSSTYLFVAQCSGGFKGGCRAQAAQRPGFADLWRLQGPPTEGAEAAQVGQVSGAADHAQGLALYGLRGTVNATHGQVSAMFRSQVFTLQRVASFMFAGVFSL